jgi:hypothetical protein
MAVKIKVHFLEMVFLDQMIHVNVILLSIAKFPHRVYITLYVPQHNKFECL